MGKPRIGWALVTMLSIGAVNGESDAWRAQTPSNERPNRALQLLSENRVLTGADVKVIQAGVRSALAGKYAIQRVLGAGEHDGSRQDEYLLDDRARVVFQRYPVRDPARPEVMRYTILEFTDVPAVRCADRVPLLKRRLGFTYYEDWKGWHLGNPMVVDDDGAPWATGSPGYDLLHAAPEDVRDLGLERIQRRLSRGLSLGRIPLAKSVWIDVVTMLPIEETIDVTLEGKSLKTTTLWSYPPPRPITRPPGVNPPDCA